jgi:hypothetical protein
MRVVSHLQKAFTLMITVGISSLWLGLWFFGLQSLKSDDNACDLIISPGEKCVGRPNEIVGSCTSSSCNPDPRNCEERFILEYNYFDCSQCVSGGSSDVCSEYRDPAACQYAKCVRKERQRRCICFGVQKQCILDPAWVGNYVNQVTVPNKECIL